MNWYSFAMRELGTIHKYLVAVYRRSWNPVIKLWAWLQIKSIEKMCGV